MKSALLKLSMVLISVTILSFKPGDSLLKTNENLNFMNNKMKMPQDIFLKLADNQQKYPFVQEKLAYGYDALEPYIDKLTMEIHYSRHHAAYTDNFNKAIESNNLKESSLFEIFSKAGSLPPAIRNNGGGFYNHQLFWRIMAPGAGGQPSGELAKAIETEFGSFDTFKEKFAEAAKTQFGSGWAWLSVTATGKLIVSKTPNQDNPLMDVTEVKGIPILCLDVWEHAYYLKYQNKRPDYISAFWNVVNWKEVERRYEEAIQLTGM